MIREYFKQFLIPWPVVPARLRLTLAALLLCIINVVFYLEIWPNTPHAEQWLLAALWLLLVLILPQLVLLGWHWVCAWKLPGWLRVLMSAAYLGGLSILLLIWLALLFSGPLLFSSWAL